MKIYKKIKTEISQFDKIICNKCGLEEPRWPSYFNTDKSKRNKHYGSAVGELRLTYFASFLEDSLDLKEITYDFCPSCFKDIMDIMAENGIKPPDVVLKYMLDEQEIINNSRESLFHKYENPRNVKI